MKTFSNPILASTVAAAALLAAPAKSAPITMAQALGLNLGTDANYALVYLANGDTLGWNSGPVAGSALFGNGATISASGGNNGGLTGTGSAVYYDSTVNGINTLSQLQNPPTETQVSTSVTQTALMTAQDVSAYAAALAPTQSFTGTVSSATTLTGNGGLNVIDFDNIHNAPLTLSGGANDLFVINVSGEFQTNVAMTLSGISASQVLFNFTGTSGQVLNTSGGVSLDGTFLATDGGQYQFSELRLNGELINTGGNVQLVSGSQIGAFSPFTPPTPPGVPEPSTFVLLSSALGLAGAWRFARRRA